MPSWSLRNLLCLGTNYYKHLCRVASRASYMSLHHSSFCRPTVVYVRVLIRIIKSDMLKFTGIFLIALYIFVGSFYLALRSGVTVNVSNGVITSDLEAFRLETL